MKLFISYIKDRAKWLLTILAVILLFAVIMALNDVTLSEITYGSCVALFLVLLIFVYDYMKYRKTYYNLCEMEDRIHFSMEGLQKPNGLMEKEYQQLLSLLMDEKIKTQNEMERKSQDVREYYTMWVHQIKTPIAALRLLLQDREEMPEESDELFRIEQYVEMALHYTRVDAEATDFVIETTKLDPVIRNAIHKYARFFVRKKIKLNYTGMEQSVLTDGKWLEFVLEQILSNAVKYTPAGEITIYTTTREVTENEATQKRTALVIQDTGMGIRAEDLPRVFEKGYTGYNGHADRHSSGIGLYLCHRIMKTLSHEFFLESEEGIGTKVWIVFPEKK